jgi:hypothetical protein
MKRNIVVQATVDITLTADEFRTLHALLRGQAHTLSLTPDGASFAQKQLLDEFEEAHDDLARRL